MKKKFIVRFTACYDYEVEVEANDRDEAENIAIDKLPPFSSGEWCNGGVECWDVEQV